MKSTQQSKQMFSALQPRIQLIILIALWSLTSCTKSSVGSAGVSDRLVITYDTGPAIGVGDDLEFWIKNESNRCISFPIDFGIKVFVRDGQRWTQVPNLGKYVGKGPILLKPKGDVFSENFVGLRPDISGLNLTAPTEFYARITGHLCDDDSVVVEKEVPFTVAP